MLLTKGFDPALLGDHFARHGVDFGARTEEEYEAMADKFLGGPLSIGTRQCVTSTNGDLIRYNFLTEEFGVLSKDGVIRTYMKPKPSAHRRRTNNVYFEERCKK